MIMIIIKYYSCLTCTLNLPTHRFNELQLEASQLSTQFNNNVLDSTKAFSLCLTDPSDVDGLPGWVDVYTLVHVLLLMTGYIVLSTNSVLAQCQLSTSSVIGRKLSTNA